MFPIYGAAARIAIESRTRSALTHAPVIPGPGTAVAARGRGPVASILVNLADRFLRTSANQAT